MARKGKSKSSNTQVRRVSYPQNARRSSLHNRNAFSTVHPINAPSPLSPYGDLRRVPPARRQIAASFTVPQVSLVPASVKRSLYPSSYLQPVVPKSVFTCVRRQIRKEVIFASGRGGTRVSKPHFTQKSKLRC